MFSYEATSPMFDNLFACLVPTTVWGVGVFAYLYFKERGNPFLNLLLLFVWSGVVAVVAFISTSHAEAPKWVIVRSMCPGTQWSVGGTPSTWSVMHTKCWALSQSAGQCAIGLRGSFASNADCARANGGVQLQTNTAPGGLKDSLRCVPRSPTANVCGISLNGSYRTREVCIAANGDGLTREAPVPGGVERTRCEMSLD